MITTACRVLHRGSAADVGASRSSFFGKLTVQHDRAPIRESLSTLLLVGVFLATLLTFPGLLIGGAYDAAHRERVTCSVSAAEAITVSSRSSRGVGSSRAGVGGGSFWLRRNTPVTVPSPTVHSIDDLTGLAQ